MLVHRRLQSTVGHTFARFHAEHDADNGSGEPVEAVVQRVLPAVVNVTTDISQATGSGQGVGTGFIVRSDGVIVTNCHVVEAASKITVFTSDAIPSSSTPA